ncbi:DUF1642 domain-containing protein [Carnobacterium sp. 1290_CSPC]|uniref:DUF1642 domain-containing protein n=1 Tax=Carnobacterium sp. 1290_CSPC TaxID=1579347 RepID=UPI0006615458|nr:DUF1642 domain-containing protein [Carnobacterium sp. 1290_CSPC]
MKIEIEKPVIPKFVADWIESNASGFNIRGILDDINNWDTPDILSWCRKVDGELSYKTLVTAYLYGYEVEEEILYYARMKGSNLVMDDIYTYWRKALGVSKLGLGCKQHEDVLVKTKMTKEEWNKLGINDTNADFEEVGE